MLDPYAKSLAAWETVKMRTRGMPTRLLRPPLDPSEYGPKELTYANIPNFKKREDALIYEAHVRDFTSDPAISKDLKSQFGTFSAFIEKLII